MSTSPPPPSSSNKASSSSLASYSPISTLEKQYAGGQRLLLYVRTNANCCLRGGVEALLKLQGRSNGSGNVGYNTSTASLSNSGMTATANSNGEEDPFAFLNSDTAAPQPDTTNPSKKKSGVGGFLKSVAKKTTSHIEKSMTELAIKADQGRNPDTLVVALTTESGTVVLSMTEPQTLPAQDHERLQGCWFAIPLELPSHVLGEVSLQLYIRSGAAFAKGKYYLLGSIPLNASQLRAQLTSSNQRTFTMPLQLQSPVVVDGQVHVCVSADAKYPTLYGRGWSVTDPDLSGYASNALFRVPLDQSYGYSIGKSWFLATERAIESTVVLPVATLVAKLCESAAELSMHHATSVANLLRAQRHDSLNVPTKANATISVAYLQASDTTKQVSLSLHWQRPDSIFEVELLHGSQLPVQNQHSSSFTPKITCPFAPPVVTNGILPSILAQYRTQPAYLLGNVRLQLRLSSPQPAQTTDPFGNIVAPTEDDEIWQATLALEPLINQPTPSPMQIPVYNHAGTQMGVVVMQLQVSLNANTITTTQQQVIPSAGGLVSLMGLDTLMETNGSLPLLDYDPTPSNDARRQQQLQTMGYFVTHQYLQQHVSATRSGDVALIQQRAKLYQQALASPPATEIPSYQDKTPKPFRPSSSRLEPSLSGIPFNVHVHSLSVERVAANTNQGALFHNVTCGAPADHARGFGNIISNTNGTDGANVSPVGSIHGGLRRLETKRLELSKAVYDAQSALIQAVGTYFQTTRQQQNNRTTHIPALHHETSSLRWKVFEATQALHHVTWTCAVRRASVFSQALGIAITSYLTSVSDVGKQAWPDLWVRHGYLVTYEGLLSAAGKELGMIEDASVGIAMLRMVSVVLVAADGNTGGSVPVGGERVAISNSPYLKWIQMTPSGVGSNTQYRVEIGMDPQYYMERIPGPLKNGTAVRLYPLLFQVGVDIRQWGAHQHRMVKDQLSTTGSGRVEAEVAPEEPVGGLLEDEDDDVGVMDVDELVSLNYEAFRKMNVYAHLISPAANGGPATNLLDDAPTTTSGANLQVHPTLTSLHAHILSSAGKMNHSILDEAASVAQSLGGGGAVFCKSGKDRTAMHVTYKQAQFARRYLSQHTPSQKLALDQNQIYQDATLMRIHGTRLPICEKNVGQAKYAFNSLQVKFMPDMLKPPPSTLAGFLKGGRVFGGGGIES